MTDTQREQLRADEIDLAVALIAEGLPESAEYATPSEAFRDPLAGSAMAAAEEIKSAGKLVSPRAVIAALVEAGEADRLGGRGHLLAELQDPDRTELPLSVVRGLRDKVSDAYRKRKLTGILDCGRRQERDPAEIAAEIIEADKGLLSHHMPRKPFLEYWTPGQCREWVTPTDYLLAGDFHLTRGGVTVIGGVPGCGKSRALVGLALAGAAGSTWMGLPVHSTFRTLIVQAENGPARLKSEFGDITPQEGIDLNEFVRISPPGSYGLPLHDPDFRAELRGQIETFRPGVVGFDPWNRIAQDDRQKDYRAAIDWILECLPEAPEARPAVVIVAHLRKRGSGDGRKRGRDLLPELSGSGMIGSAARSVFILEPASPDPEDDRVVWTCAKNNDGLEGASSAWHRRNGLFAPCDEFDFEEWNTSGSGGRMTITPDTVRDALAGGVTKKNAVRLLMDSTGCGDSAAYGALSAGGRFAKMIDETPDGLLIWAGKP